MQKNILIIGFVWPEPKSSAAGSRMLQLIKQFQNQGFAITFASAAKTSANTFDLKSIDFSVQPIVLNDSSFDVFVKTLDPEVVVFDRFMTEEQFGWRVSEQCPKALKILDTEDFHGLRKARQLAHKTNTHVTTEHLQNDTTKREIAAIYRCDLSLIISEAELHILSTEFKIPSHLLYYLPFLLVPVSETEINKLPTFKDRQHFITIGNFLHPPNYDAALHLKETIWPLIRQQLPKAQLHIYGAYASQKVTQLHNEKQGFLIKGFAEDVNVVMQNAKVCLASLRFGAGLKGKLIDAMTNGTPSVMTSIAAEGLFDNCQPKRNRSIFNDICISDNPEIFAEKAVVLYADKKLWSSQQKIGFQTINKRFNVTDFESDFALKIGELSKNLTQHRQSNFMGQVLQHHTLQSTKYMSKWIEGKAKVDT